MCKSVICFHSGTTQCMPPEFSEFKQYDGCQGTLWQIEITSWKARAYGIFTSVGEVSEIERVSTANE